MKCLISVSQKCDVTRHIETPLRAGNLNSLTKYWHAKACYFKFDYFGSLSIYLWNKELN